jgi:oligosaccharide repeat unit polymerase
MMCFIVSLSAAAFLLMALSIFFRKTIVAPEALALFSSFLSLSLLAARPIFHETLSAFAVGLFFLGVLVFGGAAFLFSRGVRAVPRSVLLTVTSNKLAESFTLIASWSLLAILFIRAVDLSQSGPFESPLMNLRWQNTSPEGEGLGWIGYARPFLTVIALREVIRHVCAPRGGVAGFWRFALYVIPGFLGAFSSMGRGHVAELVLSVLAILTLAQRKLYVRHVVFSVVLIILAYTGVGVLLKKIDVAGGFLWSSVNSITDYFSMPLVAWSVYVSANEPFGWGAYTLRILWVIGELLGVSGVVAVSNIRDFASIQGSQTNLYTFVFPYYKDFGVFGVFMFSAIVGGLVGSVFLRALKGVSPGWLIIYGLSVSSTLSVYGGERFFVLSSQWVQYLVWSFLLTRGWRLKRGR